MLWGVRAGLGPERDPEGPAQVGTQEPGSVSVAPPGTFTVGSEVPPQVGTLGWMTQQASPMAHTWVEAFMQGKWLNSANNIVVKHPHLAGEMVFPVFTFRFIMEGGATNPPPAVSVEGLLSGAVRRWGQLASQPGGGHGELTPSRLPRRRRPGWGGLWLLTFAGLPSAP